MWWFDRGGHHRGKHPAAGWIGLTLLWVGLMILHPLTSPMLVGVAQFSLYVRHHVSRVLGASRLLSLDRSWCGRWSCCSSATASIRPSASCRCTTLTGGCRGSSRRCTWSAGGDRLLAASTFIGPNGRRNAPPARPVRFGGRGGRGRHDRHHPRPHFLSGADRARQTRHLPGLRDGRDDGSLSQPRARGVRDDPRHEGGVSGDAGPAVAEKTRSGIRGAGIRPGGRSACRWRRYWAGRASPSGS